MKDILERLANSSPSDGSHVLQRLCFDAAEEISRLRLARDRYEIARRMNPRQWADAYQQCINTGKPFDEIVDDIGSYITGSTLHKL